jgi:hypothetical protein
MTPFRCPEEASGKPVSMKAEFCPHCGYPLDAVMVSTGAIEPDGKRPPAQCGPGHTTILCRPDRP